MEFRFDVSLTEKDYLDFNRFHALKSPYGKKGIKAFRISITGLLLLIAATVMFVSDFSSFSLIYAAVMVVVTAILQFFIPRFFFSSIKNSIKRMHKAGTLGYSPSSSFEFSDESFTETTPTSKTEQKYSAIQRVCIDGDKAMYIYMSNAMAYVLPMSCFSSAEERASFTKFLEGKCLVEAYA